MILEQETFEAFGYHPSELKPKSNKLILVACELCGKFRIIEKSFYRTLCGSCAQRHKHLTEETKAKMSVSSLGKVISEEQRAKISASMKGKYIGVKSPCWKPKVKCICLTCSKEFEVHLCETKGSGRKYCCLQCRVKAQFKGGKKVAEARCHAKRKRKLGYIPLNSYFEDCEGHHITHNFVIYIPKATHKSVWHNLNTDQGMEAMNTLAVDFLVNGV